MLRQLIRKRLVVRIFYDKIPLIFFTILIKYQLILVKKLVLTKLVLRQYIIYTNDIW